METNKINIILILLNYYFKIIQKGHGVITVTFLTLCIIGGIHGEPKLKHNNQKVNR